MLQALQVLPRVWREEQTLQGTNAYLAAEILMRPFSHYFCLHNVFPAFTGVRSMPELLPCFLFGTELSQAKQEEEGLGVF